MLRSEITMSAQSTALRETTDQQAGHTENMTLDVGSIPHAPTILRGKPSRQYTPFNHNFPNTSTIYPGWVWWMAVVSMETRVCSRKWIIPGSCSFKRVIFSIQWVFLVLSVGS